MGLNQEQLAIAKELEEQANDYENFKAGLPENIAAAWYRFVGQMREYFYLDEQWDGKEMTFLSKGEILLNATLEADKISIFILSGETREKLAAISTRDSADEIIQTLMTKNFPERVMPTKNVKLSPGGGLCELCLYNLDNNEKCDRLLGLAMGFALCYGHICTSAPCGGDNENCQIIDIGQGTPGLSAEQVTHILFPYWWAKSRFNTNGTGRI